MIVSAYWSPGAWFIVSATKIVAGPFKSRASATAYIEARTVRTWIDSRVGWRVTVDL